MSQIGFNSLFSNWYLGYDAASKNNKIRLFCVYMCYMRQKNTSRCAHKTSVSAKSKINNLT